MRTVLVGVLLPLAALGASTCSSAPYVAPGHAEVPCVVVPQCPGGSPSAPRGTLTIASRDEDGAPVNAPTDVALCYDASNLYIAFNATNDLTFQNDFEGCNAEFYQQEVVEAFLAPTVPGSRADTTNYTELELSPHDGLFASYIYNPFLNGSAIQHELLDCNATGIQHTASIDAGRNVWRGALTVPWALLQTPVVVPTDDAVAATSSPTAGDVWRFNFFRIRANQKLPFQGGCYPSVCEYNTWSPTFRSPPAFHVPIFFGVALLG